jgi:hypothetical protein
MHHTDTYQQRVIIGTVEAEQLVAILECTVALGGVDLCGDVHSHRYAGDVLGGCGVVAIEHHAGELVVDTSVKDVRQW